MKAAAFAYARATSVVNALELLAAHGDKAKVLSGGQSLMPAMNLRLLSPDLLVDIGGLAELQGVAVKGGTLVIGALTRHVDLLRSAEVALHAPLLREAAAHIAHPAIRNRGTLGGSLAHADPASELPACIAVLDATIVVRAPSGERRIAATEFFKGIYETALLPQELLVAVEMPARGKGSAFFFQEYARRHGDYAIAGLAARATIDDGRFSDLRLGFFAVGDRPLLAAAASKLTNVSVTPTVLADAAATLVDELDPQGDQQASPAMRRHLAQVLLRRCVAALLARPDLETGAAQ
ncbi:xanthine dehydrogenase family protein subunit M [Bradyrhizobium sp. WSM 1704]|uniref:FAD binding domain-containing protein n=1 Tax=Bradyrhizobium semiaridum TaxID=2821404 RepID=UPI001CE3744C|nr:xanthine dehydrogenase family protein subunit M [Bradyrhizobium semiaridum]MCA6121901.1 xanthine dehydrogenase family protein subunit M [Bradyrhizobium semiaridum]